MGTPRIETIARGNFEGFVPFFVNLSLAANDTQDLVATIPGRRIRLVRILLTWDKKVDWFELRSDANPITSRIYTNEVGGRLLWESDSGISWIETGIGEALRLHSSKAADYGVTGLHLPL